MAMVESFVEVCRRRALNVNAGESEAIVSGWEEGLECEVCADGIRLEHVSEFNVLGESGTYEQSAVGRLGSGRNVEGAG